MRAVLIFADTASLTAFLLTYKVAGAEVNAKQRSLHGILPEDLMVLACTRYKAEVKELLFKRDHDSLCEQL